MTENKKRGRPRKYETDAQRIKAYRQRKNADSRRLDVFINTNSSWRLMALSSAWECSPAKTIERLIMEADQRYESILFPETE